MPEDAAQPTGRRHEKYDRLIAAAQRMPAIGMAVAHPCDTVSLESAVEAAKLGFVKPILVGPAARVRAVAKEAGLDVARIEKDLNSDEVKASLEESFKLAEKLGLNGTPSYVIGENVVVGAVGLAALKEKVNTARCGKATC